MHFLGVDYGLVRMGIAYSQGDLAEPVGTFPVKTQADRVALVKRLADEHAVDAIIVGTTKSTLTPLLQSFISSLKNVFTGTIITVEEQMTTVEARAKMIAAGTSKAKRQKNIDAYAAVVILQTYLDEQHHA